jgi:hypothetical protein
MGCLAGDDVVRDATIEEMLQAVSSASLLGVLRGYISRPTKLVQSQCRQCSECRQCSAAWSSCR